MRVLLVDDEAIQRKALRVELGKLPIRRRITDFREASNGRECLEVFANYRPHVVFLDLRMPVMGGLEAARVIAEEGQCRIVILTAFDEFKYVQEALKVGAVDYLLKPASREDLTKVMEKICEQLDTEENDQREKEYLLSQLEKVKPFIQLEYVNEIISGSPLTLEMHKQKWQLLGIVSPLQLALVAEIDDYGDLNAELAEPERQTLKQRVTEVLCEEIGQIVALVARLGTDRIIALLGLPESSTSSTDKTRAWLMSLAERVRSRVNSECRAKISLGLSRVYNTPLKLHLAYQDCIEALGFKFILGANQIVHVDDIDLNEGASEEYPLELEKGLLEAIRLGNEPKAAELLPEILIKAFMKTALEPRKSRVKALELFIVMARAAGEGGAPQQELLDLTHSFLSQILASQTLLEMRYTLEAGIQSACKLVTGVRNMRNQRLVTKAIDYIKEHYHDQVSLEDLSRQVYLSPFYFSHIFKEEVGLTFIEYLTSVRMDEAKRRLRDTMVSVSIIAEQVGYNDVNYFSRVFKKVVGQTPTQYREKMFALK